jgi:pimeloyl-ACP methyl ester carboxylesterase
MKMPLLSNKNIDLYYEIYGEGDPLLFVHGLGSSGRDWELQIEHFTQNYQVIVFDLRGHGKSGKPPGPYSIPLFAEDTARMLDRLNSSPAHIVGISLGGMVAYQLGLDWPGLVKSLVIVNSTPELIVRTLQDQISVWQRLLIVRLMGMRKMGEVLGRRFFPEPEQAELRQIFVDHWAENEKPAYLEAMKATLGWSVVDRLDQIRCPTLVISSEHDYFPPPEADGYLSRITGGRMVLIEGARHAVPAEKPAVFNVLIEEFLAEQG